MFQNSLEFAKSLDEKDALAHFRDKFYIPKHHGQDTVYLCGNSLGLQPKSAKEYMDIELQAWQDFGVEGHFMGQNPWKYYHKMFAQPVANLVGALPHEVVVMNNLTTNLHLMMVSFYQPKGKRTKILMEAGAFPSDQYAVESQIRFHGLNPEEHIIEVIPTDYFLSTETIVSAIEKHADEIALVMFAGVNYYTGQAFDMQAITEAGHKASAFVGFDLAHATGNIVLQLHNWKPDFATWCSYKYLNSGPGGTSGVFVHERHRNNPNLPRFAGWWGYEEETRFQMKKGFIPMQGAEGWQLSNAQIFPMAIHKASLDIFGQTSMAQLREKSEVLSTFLAYLIDDNKEKYNAPYVKNITPKDVKDRGCQVSLLMLDKGKERFEHLISKGIIADWREPNVIRVAPVPLYNTFEDVYRFANELFE